MGKPEGLNFSRLVEMLLATNFPESETVMPPHQGNPKRENAAVSTRRTEVAGKDPVSAKI